MARYSMLLENPRRRTRKRRSRRRKNPMPLARRRRSSGRRRRRSSSRRRSNPFRIPGAGGIKGTLGRGVELYLGQVAGSLAQGLLGRVGFVANLQPSVRQIGVGLLLPMLPFRGGMIGRTLQTAGALQIAGAIAGFAAPFTQGLFDAVGAQAPAGGLADYVTDSGMSEYGLLESPDYASGNDAYLNDYVTDAG